MLGKSNNNFFYSISTYGHIQQLAETVAEGVKQTGAECDIYQIPETLPEDILKLMHAPPKVCVSQ